jgi:N-acetylglucosamine repressor
MAPTDLRSLMMTNHRLVSLLMIHGPMMRVDMAKWLGISTPAVTYRTSDLINAGILNEIGEADGQLGPGRRSQLIDLNPEGAYVLGIYRTRAEFELGLVNLKGEVVASRNLNTTLDYKENLDEIIELIAKDCRKLISEVNIPAERLLGVGVGTIGAADSQKGVEYTYRMQDGRITPVPIPTGDTLSRYFGIPIEMATKARALASGERWFGCRRNSFFLVHVHHGVSSAVVLGGYLYKGQGHAGAMGHVKASIDGPLCTCGERGCLESIVSRDALLKKIKPYRRVTDLYEAVELANNGDERIMETLCEAAKVIATACTSIVDVLEPETLVFVGPLFNSPKVLETIKQELDAHTFVGRLHQIEVSPSSFGKDAGMIGAASLVYSTLVQAGQSPDWPPTKLS